MKLRKRFVHITFNETPIKKKRNVKGPRPFIRSKIKKVSF